MRATLCSSRVKLPQIALLSSVPIWDKRVEVMLSDVIPGGARKKYNRVS